MRLPVPSFLLSVGVLVPLGRLAALRPFEPGLPAVVDDAGLAALPEPVRPFYTPVEGQAGRHALHAEGIDSHPGVAGLKANRDRLLGDVTRLKGDLSRFDGVDPEKYRSLTAAEQKLAEESAAKSGQWETLKAQMAEQHTKALEQEQAKGKSWLTALDKAVRQDAARAAIGAARGNATLLLPQVLPQTTMVEEDGTYVTRVVDAKGNVRISDASGSPMTLEQLVAEMKAKPEFAPAFAGTGMSGSDAPGGTGGAPPAVGGKKRSEMSWSEKAAYVKTHGQDKYLALPA